MSNNLNIKEKQSLQQETKGQVDALVIRKNFLGGDGVRVAYPLFQEEGSGSIPTSPLQFNISEITYSLAAQLNKAWHSRMPYIGSPSMCKPCFAAEYDGIIYAVAMWSLPIAANRIKDGFNCLELRRMAISPEAPKNTASRMLKIMTMQIKKLMPHIKRLLSYQDTEVHNGTIYKAAGWEIARVSKFVSWDEHSKRPGKIEQSKAEKVRWEKAL